ncbi:hypothetical protein [Streptomyces sp. NPDC057623]|uniref:hypothetical protein n=1 Tax=Streptomyces sp. NPDC057623 TaxID=3346187 RepID=UPI0036B4FD28
MSPGYSSRHRQRSCEIHNAWAEFSTAAAAVTVAGPRATADAADVLRTADIQNAAMDWLPVVREAGHGRLERAMPGS